MNTRSITITIITITIIGTATSLLLIGGSHLLLGIALTYLYKSKQTIERLLQ